MESNPDKFIRLNYPPLLCAIRTRVSSFLHVDADEVALVPNVNTGLTSVLRTFPWRAGDALLMSDITYDSIARSMRAMTALPPFPRLEMYTLAFPASHRQIVDAFRARLREVKSQLSVPGARIIVLFDAICSNPGVVMPWREMVRVCKEESGKGEEEGGKVYSLVDGAHAIGQDVNLNLHKDDPDFFVTVRWIQAL
jgi:hercynylcysteine S-oxide lyase